MIKFVVIVVLLVLGVCSLGVKFDDIVKNGMGGVVGMGVDVCMVILVDVGCDELIDLNSLLVKCSIYFDFDSYLVKLEY